MRVVRRWRGGRGTAACFLSLSEASVLLSGLVAGGWGWWWWRCSVQVGWRQETGRAWCRAASLPWLPPPRPGRPATEVRRCDGPRPGQHQPPAEHQEVFNFRDGRGHSGVTLACTAGPWTRWTPWTRSSRKVDKCAGTMTTDIQPPVSVQCSVAAHLLIVLKSIRASAVQCGCVEAGDHELAASGQVPWHQPRPPARSRSWQPHHYTALATQRQHTHTSTSTSTASHSSY